MDGSQLWPAVAGEACLGLAVAASRRRRFHTAAGICTLMSEVGRDTRAAQHWQTTVSVRRQWCATEALSLTPLLSAVCYRNMLNYVQSCIIQSIP